MSIRRQMWLLALAQVVVALTLLGVPVHHDNVDTGGTGGRMHYPWTGMNIPALDAWLDAL